MRAISASSPVKSAAYAAWTQHSRPQAFSVNKNVKGRVRVVGYMRAMEQAGPEEVAKAA